MGAKDRQSENDPATPGASALSFAEERRLRELRALGILDTPPDESFDRVTRLAAKGLGVPIAVVSLVDEARVWVKSRVGLETSELPRDVSFCTRVVESGKPLVISDATVDPCFAAHPLVTGAPHVRAYLGVPLYTRCGHAIGTLCAMDTRPREFAVDDIAAWNDFAGLVQEMVHARELSVESELLLRSAAASEQKHTEMGRRLQRIADHIPALIGYWNTELRCEFANDAYRAYSGLTPEQMIGRHFREVLGEELFVRNSPHAYSALNGEPQRFQRCMPGADGNPRYTEGQYLPDRDATGAVRGFFVLVTDITELTAAKGALEVSNAKLLKESTTDFLTGLANRRVFSDRAEAAYRQLQEAGEGYALILMDLDDFKQINDRLGHEIGDRVLRAVGEVLGGQLRGRDDLAARLGGEEFGILCPGSFTEDSLREMAGRIRDQINKTTVDSPRGRCPSPPVSGLPAVTRETPAGRPPLRVPTARSIKPRKRARTASSSAIRWRRAPRVASGRWGFGPRSSPLTCECRAQACYSSRREHGSHPGPARPTAADGAEVADVDRHALRDFSHCSPQEVQDAMERAEVVFYGQSPVELPGEADLEFMRAGLPRELQTKNISYHPESDSIPRFQAAPAITQRIGQILRNHGQRVADFLTRTCPDFAPGWTLGTTSFRPIEEQGRRLKPRASNELVHIDAGAYGATNGARILRFFVNIHPTRDRVWGTKGGFMALLGRHPELREAAGNGKARIRMDKGRLDALYSGVLRGVAQFYPQVRVIDSSPYDRAMRRIHNFMKEDAGFRDSRQGYQEIHFPPLSAWMVFTDGISHSVPTGQHALVTTVLVPLANCRHRDLTPHAVLARD